MKGEIIGELSTSSQVVSEGVVAFIDALGTKGISARTDPEEYARSWELLLTEWEQYKNEAAKTSGFLELKVRYKSIFGYDNCYS
jgi:hypothetical protein